MRIIRQYPYNIPIKDQDLWIERTKALHDNTLKQLNNIYDANYKETVKKFTVSTADKYTTQHTLQILDTFLQRNNAIAIATLVEDRSVTLNREMMRIEKEVLAHTKAEAESFLDYLIQTGRDLTEANKYYETELKLNYVKEISEQIGIVITGKTLDSMYLKAKDLQYIKRKLVKLAKQNIEFLNYLAGRVGKNQAYASASMQAIRLRDEERQQKFIDNAELVDKSTGEVLKLKDFVPTNKARFSEIYMRSKELEKSAEEQGFTWRFVTMTLEPHKHINPKIGKNSWDRTTSPKDGARDLSARWSKARAQIAKSEIEYFGLWSKEAHKDATPHMHALIYADESHMAEIERCIITQFGHDDVETDDDIRKDIKIEVPKTIKQIRESKGQKVKKGENPNHTPAPTSYITKYLLKSLGFNPNTNLSDESTFTTDDGIAQRAACLTWSYRRYGFFGIDNGIMLWRKVRSINIESLGDSYGETKLKHLAELAQNNLWQGFMDFKKEYDFKLEFEAEINKYNEESLKYVGITCLQKFSNFSDRVTCFRKSTFFTVTVNLSCPRVGDEPLPKDRGESEEQAPPLLTSALSGRISNLMTKVNDQNDYSRIYFSKTPI